MTQVPELCVQNLLAYNILGEGRQMLCLHREQYQWQLFGLQATRPVLPCAHLLQLRQ